MNKLTYLFLLVSVLLGGVPQISMATQCQTQVHLENNASQNDQLDQLLDNPLMPADAKTSEPVVLKLHVEHNGIPRIEEFEQAVRQDWQVPCAFVFSLPRFVRSAGDDRMRRIVWQRMRREELVWLSRREVKHIEELAAQFEMPVTRPKAAR